MAHNLLFIVKLLILVQLVVGATDSSTTDNTTPNPLSFSTPIVEEFNELANSGTSQPFAQGSTVSGWWSTEDQYVISDGSLNMGGLYSFGEASNSDRALGAITSNKKKSVAFGVTLQPTAAVSTVNISFLGEQWRYGGDMPDDNTLIFEYSIMTLDEYNNGGWGGSGNPSTAWITVSQLNVVGVNSGPNNTVGPVRFSSNLASTLPTPNLDTGSVLQFRWTAHNIHDGLAIDNFNVVIASTPVPTSTPTQKPTSAPSGPLHNMNTDKIWKVLTYTGWSMAVVITLLFIVIIYKGRRNPYNPIQPPVEDHDPETGALGTYAAYDPRVRAQMIARSDTENSRLLNDNVR